MSTHLKKNYKKAIFSLLVAGCSVGAITPLSYLNAATVNDTVTADKASIQVNDTTITFNGMKDIKNGKNTSLAFDVTIDKTSGIPEKATQIDLEGKGTVTVNNKRYQLNFSNANLNKISNTQATATITTWVIPAEDNLQSSVSLNAAQVKGKSIEFQIEGVQYLNKITTLSEEFKAQLKNVSKVEGVSPKEAGVGYMKGTGKFIPAKGLNIPILEGDNSILLDNIGFVNGKLALRTKRENGSSYILEFSNSKGKHLVETGYSTDTKNVTIDTWDAIKDMATLRTCTLKIDADVVVATDTEAKTITLVF